MAEVGFRDLGSFVPGRRVRDTSREPSPPPLPAASPRVEPAAAEPTVLVTPPPARVQRPVFAGDRPDGPDMLGIDEALAQLAELALHKGTKGPLSIGLIGGTGSGKSFALRRLASRIGDLAGAAAKTGGPFVSSVHLETIDAASLDGEPALALAARLHATLQKPYPELAREIGATARDPHAVLRGAEEKLDDARRRLDTERRALDEAGTRRARLTETVLYEASGSQVDAYARANRSGIESRLAGFGIGGDPIRNYKDLVQLVTGSGSVAALALRSLWAFKGQLKLIVAAIALVSVGIGLGMAIDDQAAWLGGLRGGPKVGASVADWMEGHMGLLATAKTAAYALAALALIANPLRAIAFMRPILKGAQLFESDLDSRRRDLDGLCAHQTKRVDTLEGAVDRLTRDVAEAERRAGSAPGARHEPSPFEPAEGPARAQDVFAALAAAMADDKIKAPQRIILALDHLDATSPDRGRAILDALHRAAVPGLVAIVGADAARLDPDGARRGDLERWLQVPFRIDTPPSAAARQALLREALGHGDHAFTPPKLDAARSDLDAPIADEEAALLAALSDLAGHTPRALKRFANLFRLARLGDERLLGPLAFMLAVMLGGTEAEQTAAVDATAGDASARYELPNGGARLRAAFDAAVALGGRITKGEAAEAMRRAASFSLAPPGAV